MLFPVDSHFLNCPETAYDSECLHCGEVCLHGGPTLQQQQDMLYRYPPEKSLLY